MYTAKIQLHYITFRYIATKDTDAKQQYIIRQVRDLCARTQPQTVVSGRTNAHGWRAATGHEEWFRHYRISVETPCSKQPRSPQHTPGYLADASLPRASDKKTQIDAVSAPFPSAIERCTLAE